MDLPILEMDRTEARAAFLEYRRSVNAAAEREIQEATGVLANRRAEMAEQDAALMRGYRLLALGRQIINLEATILAGGFDDAGRPRIAVANAIDRGVNMSRTREGHIRFTPDTRWRRGEMSARSRTRTFTFDGPAIPADVEDARWGIHATAIAPIIPPRLRPARPERYALLWEAEWRRRAPVDPALLRPLGGGLYAVMATWDLTPLEQTILGLSS